LLNGGVNQLVGAGLNPVCVKKLVERMGPQGQCFPLEWLGPGLSFIGDKHVHYTGLIRLQSGWGLVGRLRQRRQYVLGFYITIQHEQAKQQRFNQCASIFVIEMRKNVFLIS
jgi:hypothetical protein